MSTETITSTTPDRDLYIEVTGTPEVVFVRIAGEAALHTVDYLDFVLMRLSACRPCVVRFDLSELTFLSSLAMGLLVRFQRSLARVGGFTEIVGAQPLIHEALFVAGIAERFGLGPVDVH
jgi:anti-anti-sigma factor